MLGKSQHRAGAQDWQKERLQVTARLRRAGAPVQRGMERRCSQVSARGRSKGLGLALHGDSDCSSVYVLQPSGRKTQGLSGERSVSALTRD